MFQFPGFASRSYVFTTGYLPCGKWVSPFGNLRVKACLPAYRSLSQAATSFIAFCRLGIHHMRLVTWSYNLKRFRAIGQMSDLYILAKECSVRLH